MPPAANVSPWKNGNPLQACPTCGGPVTAVVWNANGDLRASVADGIEARMIRRAPEWAAIYALQGMERVTRYTCTPCNNVIATLAADND